MVANKKKNNMFMWVCFIAYLLLLGYVLFYGAFFGRVEHDEYRYNLIFFQEINRYYGIGIRTGIWTLFLWNVIGNILVFLPLGMFLPSLFTRCKNLLFTAFLSMELSLCVELVQLVTKVGSFDVDDILLNTVGGICGFIICMASRSMKKKRR